jgi:hypothetical protein
MSQLQIFFAQHTEIKWHWNGWDALLSQRTPALTSSFLTYSMELSPSWEANEFTPKQEFPRILWNSKVHYRIHKRPPIKSDQSSPCLQPTSWKFILILSSHLCLGIPSGLFHLGFPTKTLYTPYSPPYMLHASPSHSSWFDYQKIIWWAVQIIKLHTV